MPKQFITRDLELPPLNDAELKLCLTLLRWRGAAAGFERRVLRKIQLPLSYVRFVDAHAILKRKKSTYRIASASVEAEQESIMAARQKWRDRLACQAMLSEDELKKYFPEGWKGGADFDAYSLTAYEFDLRFRVKVTPIFATKRKFIRAVVPMIRRTGELFDWFFWRAILNSQFSRFAHCCVCDAWVLKGIAGQRSGVVANWVQRHGDRNSKLAIPCPKCKEEVQETIARLKTSPTLTCAACQTSFGIKADDFRRKLQEADQSLVQKWPKWMGLLPMWPAVCDSAKCRNLFQHVVRGNSPKRIDDFRGLMGSPNTRTNRGASL